MCGIIAKTLQKTKKVMAEQGTQDFHVIAKELAKDTPTYPVFFDRSKEFSQRVHYPEIAELHRQAAENFCLSIFKLKAPEEKSAIRKLRQNYQLIHWIDDYNTPLCPYILNGIRLYSLDQLRILQKEMKLSPEVVASMAARSSTFLQHVRIFNCSPH